MRSIRLLIIPFVLLMAVSNCRKNEPCTTCPPSEPDTTSHSISWRVDTLGTYSSYLFDVWGPGSSDLYAVGYLRAEGASRDAYISQYDGIRWNARPDSILSFGLQAGGLQGIHGLSSNNMVVVGASYNSILFKGFAAIWNGSAWHDISPPNSMGLNSVWMKSSNDIYAVGEGGTLLRFDGAKWDSLPSPTDLAILRLVGVPTGELFAVAADYANYLTGSVILRISGTTVDVEKIIPGRRLFSIWGQSSSNLYAVGDGVFHRDDQGVWSEVNVNRSNTALFAVNGTKDSDILLAGAYQLILHWNGNSWYEYSDLFQGSSSIILEQVIGFPDGYTIVGQTGSYAIVLRGTRIN